MPITKDHFIHGSIAAVVGAAVAGGAVYVIPKHVEQVTHEIAISKHAWPDLTDAQKDGLSTRLAGLKGERVIVMAADAAGTDLAEDIDDAMEKAGVDSAIDRPALPLGYGIGVVAEDAKLAKADELAASLHAVTDLTVSRTAGKSLGGVIIVVIGKHPH